MKTNNINLTKSIDGYYLRTEKTLLSLHHAMDAERMFFYARKYAHGVITRIFNEVIDVIYIDILEFSNE